MTAVARPGRPGQPGQPGRAARLDDAVAAQDGRCLWCGRAFSALVPATTDHLVPRVRGGPSWAPNEVAACRRCNGQRGHTGAADWLEECERRGWSPDARTLLDRLAHLEAEIAARGGQRRARPQVASQLRRLRRRSGAAGRLPA